MPLNIITYAPTATLNLVLNTAIRDSVTVVGYVNGRVVVELISE